MIPILNLGNDACEGIFLKKLAPNGTPTANNLNFI